MDFHSISCMNVESCDRLITLHWNFGCCRCSATGHFDPISLVLRFLRTEKIFFCRCGIFVCSLCFCHDCGFRWRLAQGLSSDTACLAREKRERFWMIFLTCSICLWHCCPVGLICTEPLHNCCLLCRSDFLGDTLSVMCEVMDFCLILVAPSSRVPWCPSSASMREVTAVICKSCHNYPRVSPFHIDWLLQVCQETSPMRLSPTQNCFLCSSESVLILFWSSS